MPSEVWIAADAHCGQQGAQFFLGDPRRQDLADVVLGHDGVPLLGEAGVRQAFPSAEQPAAAGVSPAVMQDIEVDGYRQEAGTLAAVGICAIHRDPALWDNPLVQRAGHRIRLKE